MALTARRRHPLLQSERQLPMTETEACADLDYIETDHPLERMKREVKQRTVSRSLVEQVITNVLSNHSNKLEEKSNLHRIKYIKEPKIKESKTKEPKTKVLKENPLKSTTYIKRAQEVMPATILSELKK